MGGNEAISDRVAAAAAEAAAADDDDATAARCPRTARSRWRSPTMWETMSVQAPPPPPATERAHFTCLHHCESSAAAL